MRGSKLQFGCPYDEVTQPEQVGAYLVGYGSAFCEPSLYPSGLPFRMHGTLRQFFEGLHDGKAHRIQARPLQLGDRVRYPAVVQADPCFNPGLVGVGVVEELVTFDKQPRDGLDMPGPPPGWVIRIRFEGQIQPWTCEAFDVELVPPEPGHFPDAASWRDPS